MTTINPETQVVASSYDRQSRTCSYTYEHSDGSRYTIRVPLDELNKHPPGPAGRIPRQRFLAQAIISHIQSNPPDRADGR